MNDKLQIRDDDALEIVFEGHDPWELFWRRARGPYLVFTAAAIVAVLVGGWIGFAWWKVGSAVGAFYLFEVLFVGAGFYREAERYASAATLRLDDDGAVLLDGNGEIEERVPMDSIHMLQDTSVSTSVDPRNDDGTPLPDGARRELTLHTEEGLMTVLRGVSTRQARRAADAFEERLSDEE